MFEHCVCARVLMHLVRLRHHVCINIYDIYKVQIYTRANTCPHTNMPIHMHKHNISSIVTALWENRLKFF